MSSFVRWGWGKLKNIVQFPLRYAGYRTLRTEDHDEEEGEGEFNEFVHPIFQEYKLTQTPRVFRGTLREIISRSVEDGKLILVYLHAKDHMNTEEFLKNVMCSRDFINLLRENFLFYVSDVYKQEGYQLSSQLSATMYPFLGILMSSQSQTRKIVQLGKIEGTVDSVKVCQELGNMYRRAQPQILSDRQHVERIRMDRQQRNEQDEEYEQAMQQDREREERERSEKRVEKEREELANERERIIAHNQINRLELRQHFEEEKENMNEENSILLRFKFPDGSSLQRMFLKDKKIAELYEFIHCLDESMSSWVPKDTSTLQNYTLTINFPKTVLSPERNLVDCEKELHNQVIFVTEIEY